MHNSREVRAAAGRHRAASSRVYEGALGICAIFLYSMMGHFPFPRASCRMRRRGALAWN